MTDVRPNILFIQADQMTALALKAYGNRFCHSPALDRLADTGAVFENAYCNFPLCAPSRFSMAAGQLCSQIGAFDNAAEFPAEIPTYAHHLRRLGYHTALSGKMHFIGPDQFHGFEDRLTADLYPADFSWVPNWSNEGKRDTNDPRSVTISGLCSQSRQLNFDEEVTDKAVQFLQSERKPGQPFFLQVSYTHPHEPYLCRPEYWALYDDASIAAPRVPALNDDQYDAHSKRLLQDFGMWNHKFSDDDIQRSRKAYFGSISFIDDQVNRLLDTLKQLGLDQHTAIVFTSDHGDMLGERGMWFKKHFYEPSLRVPLFVNAPWIAPCRIPGPASLVDLLPTFCDLAGDDLYHQSKEQLAGESLLPPTKDTSAFDDRIVYAEYLAEATLSPIVMVRQNHLKLVYSETDKPLLFDLQTDPDELENLADQSEYDHTLSHYITHIHERWDLPGLARRIVESQQRRLLIREAHRQGEEVRWNHDESPGQKVQWYRGVGGYSEWAFDYEPVP
ncbi:MAG: choline-sulfatase [Pseudomonadota bacterium]